jgi:hypothetical protein
MDEPLTLANFRTEMSEAALWRGYMYNKNGWVKGPRELLPDYFEYTVHEVNTHAVTFSRDDDTFTDLFCTCDPDNILNCRHLAAVLFFIEAEENDSVSESLSGTHFT